MARKGWHGESRRHSEARRHSGGCTQILKPSYRKMLNERYGVPYSEMQGKSCGWIDARLRKEATR